jgi:hypothetical protein
MGDAQLLMEGTVEGGTVGLDNLAVQDLNKSPSNAASDPGLRISVPLESRIAARVAERCQETGLSLSDFVRRSLSQSISTQTPHAAVQVEPTASRQKEAYEFPKSLEELLPQFRSFGAGVWKERRLMFRATIALAEIARQNSG